MKKLIQVSFSFWAIILFGLNSVHANERVLQVTFTNLTARVILTPPVFATTSNSASVFELNNVASEALQIVAEGGDTNPLAQMFHEQGAIDVVQYTAPVLPGESITISINGRRSAYLSMASMILPSNDGFVALNGKKIRRMMKRGPIFLKAYDAGSEENSESCEDIPGPQCGGEGFSSENGEGYVFPHAGIHGEADLSRKSYSWGNPVARISVRMH